MINNKFKDQIDHSLCDVTVSKELKEDILSQTQLQSRAKRTGPSSLKRVLLTAAAVLLIIVIPVTVLGSTIPAVNSFIAAFSEKFANFLMPINQISEQNGVKLQVYDASYTTDMIFMSVSLEKEGGFDSAAEIDEYHIGFEMAGVNGFTVTTTGQYPEEGIATYFICAFITQEMEIDKAATVYAGIDVQNPEPEIYGDQDISHELVSITFPLEKNVTVLEKECNLLNKGSGQRITRFTVLPSVIVVNFGDISRDAVNNPLNVTLKNGDVLQYELKAWSDHIGCFINQSSGAGFNLEDFVTINPDEVESITWCGMSVDI